MQMYDPGRTGQDAYARQRLAQAQRAGLFHDPITNAAQQWQQVSAGLSGAARSNGFTNPNDFLRQSANAGHSVNRTAGAYVRPQTGGMGADSYAAAMLDKVKRAGLANTSSSAGPAAQWRDVSQQLTQQAAAAGYSDPRVWLQRLLAQQGHVQAGDIAPQGSGYQTQRSGMAGVGLGLGSGVTGMSPGMGGAALGATSGVTQSNLGTGGRNLAVAQMMLARHRRPLANLGLSGMLGGGIGPLAGGSPSGYFG